MPPNVTALIQPMDQKTITLTKLHYRNQLMATIIVESGRNSVIDILKKVTVKCVQSRIWYALGKKITPLKIKKCWKNILYDAGLLDDEDNLPLLVLKAKLYKTVTK